MLEANDNGLTYWVQFFDGPEDDAIATDRLGPFSAIAAAIDAATEAHAYALRNKLPWFPTEIVFE